jgi:UDP-2-acetamido-2,6-beta-L-arabino-hexul-4-ose reductase
VTRVAITGAGGSLGFHVRAALREAGAEVVAIPLGDAYDRQLATTAVSGADLVLHLAGVNRASDDEVANGNDRMARQLAEAVRAAPEPPARLSYAGTVHASGVYGDAKTRAGETLREAAADVGTEFVGHRLPNLFGEHGRPHYNAVTATFSHLLASGEAPTVDVDRELELLHAQDAADVLTGAVPPSDQSRLVTRITVSGLLERLRTIARTYAEGEIPDVGTPFDRDLFNTYRSHAHPLRPVIPITAHADARGSFFELVKSHGGDAQTSYSTSEPGVTRGVHFHRRKIERFIVITGTARISMRRLFSDEVVAYDVGGGDPVAIDMPTLWAHDITNTGKDVLRLALWTNDLFDPTRPDTIPEPV